MRKLNNSIMSEKFLDGVVHVYPLDRLGEIDEEHGLRFFFGERNLTYKRIMEARQIQSEYARVIAIPLLIGKLGKMRCAVISGRKYRIETVQEIHTTLPPVAVLGLSDWEIDTQI